MLFVDFKENMYALCWKSRKILIKKFYFSKNLLNSIIFLMNKIVIRGFEHNKYNSGYLYKDCFSRVSPRQALGNAFAMTDK